MTDFSPHLQPTASWPTVRQAFGVEIPAIEICDVGAMSEGTDRYAGLVAQGIANVNGFEPDAEQFARLTAVKRPRSRYFQAFLGTGEPATFHIARYPGCSSLYEADASVINLFNAIGASAGGNFTVESTEPVQTTRLDDVPEFPAIQYLKLDIQGGELDVLKGASRALMNVLVAECEVEFLPIYKNQPLFGDIQIFLRERGFVFHKFLDISGRAFRPLRGPGGNVFTAMSQVLWADAIFVRDFSRLERFSDDELIQAAAIMMEAYRSHDLVHYLLTEFDRRRGTETARQFGQTVLSRSDLKLEYMTHQTAPTRMKRQ